MSRGSDRARGAKGQPPLAIACNLMAVMNVPWLKHLWRLLLAWRRSAGRPVLPEVLAGDKRDGLFGGPGDPYVGVRVPKHRSPSGRSAAVAVEEPSEGRLITAVSRGTR
jgi:hypothetical protein